jgi:hypothetical protein
MWAAQETRSSRHIENVDRGETIMELRMRPIWTFRAEQADMRIISLALAGKLKPESKDAKEARALLDRLNAQRLKDLEEQSDLLRGHIRSLEEGEA